MLMLNKHRFRGSAVCHLCTRSWPSKEALGNSRQDGGKFCSELKQSDFREDAVQDQKPTCTSRLRLQDPRVLQEVTAFRQLKPSVQQTPPVTSPLPSDVRNPQTKAQLVMMTMLLTDEGHHAWTEKSKSEWTKYWSMGRVILWKRVFPHIS